MMDQVKGKKQELLCSQSVSMEERAIQLLPHTAADFQEKQSQFANFAHTLSPSLTHTLLTSHCNPLLRQQTVQFSHLSVSQCTFNCLHMQLGQKKKSKGFFQTTTTSCTKHLRFSTKTSQGCYMPYDKSSTNLMEVNGTIHYDQGGSVFLL